MDKNEIAASHGSKIRIMFFVDGGWSMDCIIEFSLEMG